MHLSILSISYLSHSPIKSCSMCRDLPGLCHHMLFFILMLYLMNCLKTCFTVVTCFLLTGNFIVKNLLLQFITRGKKRSLNMQLKKISHLHGCRSGKIRTRTSFNRNPMYQESLILLNAVNDKNTI